MRSFPNVRFITASQAYSLYRDEAHWHEFGRDDLAKIAQRVSPQIDFQVYERYALSASEAFALLNFYVAAVIANRTTTPITLHSTPYGPSSPGYALEAAQLHEVAWNQFSRTVLDVQNFLEQRLCIPSTIWLGSTAVSPESYLLALSNIARQSLGNGSIPDRISISPAELVSKRFVAKDSAAIWNWPIFPPGFHAPHLMELASLQAWTLKPAILHPVSSSGGI